MRFPFSCEEDTMKADRFFPRSIAELCMLLLLFLQPGMLNGEPQHLLKEGESEVQLKVENMT